MLISPRPAEMKFKDRGNEKISIVLAWILEWRVSSLDILAARLGQRPSAATKFFKMLLQRNILERIRVKGCHKRDLVILGPEGHKMLGTTNLGYAAEINRVRKYTKKKTVTHDLESQKAALKLLPGAMEIVSDFNIKMDKKTPDALVFRWSQKTEKVWRVAVEMEKTAKGSKAIFAMLDTYLEIIGNKEIDEVRFFFSHEDDLKTYRRYFDREMWPYTGSKKIGDKVFPTTLVQTIAKDDWRRARFVFEHLDPDAPPAIFPLVKAANSRPTLILPYQERIKDQEREPLIQKAIEEERSRKQRAEEKIQEALAEEEEERNAVLERLGFRREKIASLEEAVSKAKTEDSALKAWVPGYKFQTQSALEALVAYLKEELTAEDKLTIEAYELQ